MPEGKKKRQPQKWEPPSEWFAASEPEEFKFCFALMIAAMSGQMPMARPKPLYIDGKGGYVAKNTAFNRGMLAVIAHWHEAHPRSSDEDVQPEFHALSIRLMELAKFINKCLDEKDSRIERYVKRESANQGTLDLAEPLIEAGATAKFTEQGFDAESLFSIAGALVAKHEDG